MPRLKSKETERGGEIGGDGDFLEALARGLRVLQAFDRDRRQLTLSDVARQVDLPRASVRRSLHTLVRLGFAETDGRLFRLTPRVLKLASAYLLSNAISDVIQPALERLSAEVGEACSAAVRDGDDVIWVAHAAPNRVFSVTASIGFRIPAVASALGRVFLAELDDRELDAFLARVKPEKLTPRTETDRAVLRRAIVQVRENGYALVDQEVEAGFHSIAVPLRRVDGSVIASLNIGVPGNRGTGDTLARLLPRLKTFAEELRGQMI